MRINWENEFNEHQWISRKTISITMQIIWKLIIWSMIINDKPPGRDSTTLPANARGLFGDGMEDWSNLWKNIWTYHVIPIIYPQFPSSHVVVISFWWIYRVWILYTNIPVILFYHVGVVDVVSKDTRWYNNESIWETIILECFSTPARLCLWCEPAGVFSYPMHPELRAASGPS